MLFFPHNSLKALNVIQLFFFSSCTGIKVNYISLLTAMALWKKVECLGCFQHFTERNSFSQVSNSITNYVCISESIYVFVLCFPVDTDKWQIKGKWNLRRYRGRIWQLLCWGALAGMVRVCLCPKAGMSELACQSDQFDALQSPAKLWNVSIWEFPLHFASWGMQIIKNASCLESGFRNCYFNPNQSSESFLILQHSCPQRHRTCHAIPCWKRRINNRAMLLSFFEFSTLNEWLLIQKERKQKSLFVPPTDLYLR